MKAFCNWILLIVTIFALGGITASAQTSYYPPTPPQGPAPASGNTVIPVDLFLSSQVYGTIDAAVKKNNDSHQHGHTGTFIKATKTRYSPWMYATQYSDQPNESVARTSYLITYGLSDISYCTSSGCISYPFSRTVSQAIDIDISCEGFYTGTGTLTATNRVAKAYLEPDHDLLEDTLGGILWGNIIPNLVDSAITGQLRNLYYGTNSAPIKDIHGQPISCNRLGVTASPNQPNWETINYDYIRPIRGPFTGVPQIAVRVLQVRRLTLHNRNGEVGDPLENPTLVLWAGWSRISIPLGPMSEGQVYTVPASSPAVFAPMPPINDQLVLIANMVYRGNEDSTFDIFDKSINYGSGTQKFNTPKIWFELDPQISRKPIEFRGDAYEVTLQITVPQSIFRAAF